MTYPAIDPHLLHAWVEGRSLARQLPPPVADHDGWRVDTASAAERSRWIFASSTPMIADLASTLDGPGYAIKLCGTVAELEALMPPEWPVEHTGWFMIASGTWPSSPLPTGYTRAVDRTGGALHARIVSDDGSLAASGHAGETASAFVYDRIETAAAHRRKGLGRAVMSGLCQARERPDAAQLLVATDAGRALYATLGWRVLAPYATASSPR